MNELKELLKKSYSFYSVPVPDDKDVLDRWTELFQKHGAQRLKSALAQHCKTSRFAPRPVDIFQILISEKPRKTQFFVGRERTKSEIAHAGAAILKIREVLEKRKVGEK